jgi:hypothetical protein
MVQFFIERPSPALQCSEQGAGSPAVMAMQHACSINVIVSRLCGDDFLYPFIVIQMMHIKFHKDSKILTVHAQKDAICHCGSASNG